MFKLTTFLFFLLSIGSISEYTVHTDTHAPIAKIQSDHTINDEPYQIKFDVKKAQHDQYKLMVNIALKEGSFFVSPYSKGDFSGQYKISLNDNQHLTMNKTFVETPRSVEQFDPHPFVNGLVNWVKETTTYEYNLDVVSDDNFEVEGLIQFVIEPRCTMEKVRFQLSYQKGEMKIKEII